MRYIDNIFTSSAAWCRPLLHVSTIALNLVMSLRHIKSKPVFFLGGGGGGEGTPLYELHRLCKRYGF